jgi:hypothetical protein
MSLDYKNADLQSYNLLVLLNMLGILRFRRVCRHRSGSEQLAV